MTEPTTKTVNVTLSGGDFGGQILQWPVGQETHTIADTAGNNWTYTLLKDGTQAVLSSVVPNNIT